MKKTIILLVITCLNLSISSQIQAQFKVQLIRIKCLVPEESSDDETYINVGNKVKVWHYNQATHHGDIGSGDLDNQDVRSLTHVLPIKFNCPTTIQVWEGDGGGSSDDLLGELKINVDKNYAKKFGKMQSKEFRHGNDWWYRIHYVVTLDD